MSELDDAASRLDEWLQPFEGDEGPCGPDLEYDNDFLALVQAAAGKPETQFSAAEPPDWPRVRELAEELLGRSRDLRLAIYWLRSGVCMFGYAALAPGLTLVNRMLESLWDGLHPLPDPDDGDPYARVNALTVLRESEGLIGDLRTCHVVRDRAVGELTVRAIELTAGLAQIVGDETAPSADSQRLLLAAALERQPDLRAAVQGGLTKVQELVAIVQQRLPNDAPDFKPLLLLAKAVAAALPVEVDAGTEEGEEAEAGGESGVGVPRRGLSGSVGSREEALRAIDLVCQYLERTEPTNPAALFLRRARHLVNHNFLQLMKELAPDALPEVARLVGVDPESVETPPPS